MGSVDVGAKLRRIVASRTNEERHLSVRDLVEEIDEALSCPRHKAEAVGCETCYSVAQIRAEIRRMLGQQS